ncbi:hypothetical protein M3Y99_00499800 [Aphelenchoides fujianensis]|nr:hypothetical protein M3Y99_00499800 [Aphelenchoides fujianensis]
MGRYNSEPVSEAEIAQGVWRILAKLKSTSGGPVELSVDERSLRLAAGCTLKSEIHTDAYVISVLAKASDLLVMLKHLQFLSSHVQLEPVVVIPFVQAVKDYYDPLRMQFDHYAQEEMGLSLLEQKVAQHFRSVRCIMLFLRRPENVEHVLPIWHSLSEHLLEVIPAYLDTISEYESIEAVPRDGRLDPGQIRRVGRHHRRVPHLPPPRLWSDKLVALMTRAFLDQQRLSEHVDKIELTPWSQYFATALEAKGNCDKQITPTLLTELMEQSCLDYGLQFSQKILEKMKGNKQIGTATSRAAGPLRPAGLRQRLHELFAGR